MMNGLTDIIQIMEIVNISKRKKGVKTMAEEKQEKKLKGYHRIDELGECQCSICTGKSNDKGEQ